MKPDLRQYVPLLVGLLFAALIFVVDLPLPLGVGIGYLYLVLVAGVAWYGDRRSTFIIATLSTLLLGVGFYLSPPGVTAWIAAVNRVVAIVLLWCTAFLVSDRRRLLSQVVEQAEQLRSANNMLGQHAEQLTEANRLLQDQAEELVVQAEELQSQNEELLSLTATLEQRVQERTAELRRANESLQVMSARLVDVQENERRAISRELHDESGQLLTAIVIRLGLLRGLWEQGASPAAAIDELKRMIDQLAEGLHRLTVNLRPASLDRAGLVPALEQYIESYRRTYGLRVDFWADGMEGDRLSPELESSLYRIVQEALTNVARHARASHVGVMLTERADSIAVIVEDDGIGFDVQEALARAGRLGLAGMQERAELRGGKLKLESRPGAGTTVFVEVPCPQLLPAPPAAT